MRQKEERKEVEFSNEQNTPHMTNQENIRQIRFKKKNENSAERKLGLIFMSYDMIAPPPPPPSNI